MRRVIILGDDADEVLDAMRAVIERRLVKPLPVPAMPEFDFRAVYEPATPVGDDVRSTNQSPGHGSLTIARRAMAPSVKRLVAKTARETAAADLTIPGVKAAADRRAARAAKRLADAQKGDK